MDGRDAFDPNDDLYDFTDDQIQAMLELDLLQKEAIECSEIDTRARLAEVNRALAEDPTPVESRRNIRVAFKPEVVDLVVPPEDLPSDDEDETEDGKGNQGDKEEEDDYEEESGSSVFQDGDEDEEAESDEETARIDAEECENAAFPESSGESLNENNNREKKSEDEDSAAHSSGDQTTINSSLENEEEEEEQRAQFPMDSKTDRRLQRPMKSPKTLLNMKGDDENSNETFMSYATTSSYTKPLKRKSKQKKEEEKQEEERKRKEAADKAFQGWLRHKRQKAKEQKRKEKKENEEKHKEMPVDNSTAIKDYWRRKRQEARAKQKKAHKQIEEIQRLEELRLKNRQEVELAYQNWMKMKKQQARMEQDEERRKNMITKLSLRNNRRSQALALALSTAGRFIDYYGYR